MMRMELIEFGLDACEDVGGMISKSRNHERVGGSTGGLLKRRQAKTAALVFMEING